MKTREEVEQLKSEWAWDPCWDIENTEGFKEYYDELLAYRLETKAEDQKEIDDENEKMRNELGCNAAIYPSFGIENRRVRAENKGG